MEIMNILAIGDIIGGEGCRFLREKLPALKRLKGIHLTIANGENSADGNGITPSSAKFLFDSGVDVITTGNHAFRRRESYDLFDSEPFLLRPANFPKGAPGHGWCVVDKGRVQVCISNIMGTVYMESMACPFETVSSIIEKTPEAGIQIVDFHAEATGEKRALAFFLDGRASALFGTHTHVQTADETVLPQGLGYISDAGMTGPILSVLGVKPELAIAKMKTKMPVRFEYASAPSMLNAVLFEINDKTGKTLSAERINIQ